MDKRFNFNVNKNCIEYESTHFAYCNGEELKIVRKLNELHEENIILKKELDDVFKLLDGVSITEFLELIKQYTDLNIHFSKIKNTYVDEKRRLIGIDYND